MLPWLVERTPRGGADAENDGDPGAELARDWGSGPDDIPPSFGP
jgi:hypothetical protein